MSATQSAPTPSGPAVTRWYRGGGARGAGKKFLTLREGSIIVVTLIAGVYFAARSDRFVTTSNNYRRMTVAPSGALTAAPAARPSDVGSMEAIVVARMKAAGLS